MSKVSLARIPCGLNLARYEKLCRDLEGTVELVRRTGELRFRHPASNKTVTVNRRRKDASRALSGWLNDLIARIRP